MEATAEDMSRHVLVSQWRFLTVCILCVLLPMDDVVPSLPMPQAVRDFAGSMSFEHVHGGWE